MNKLIDWFDDWIGNNSYVIINGYGQPCYYYFNQQRKKAEAKALKLNHRYGDGWFHVEELYW